MQGEIRKSMVGKNTFFSIDTLHSKDGRTGWDNTEHHEYSLSYYYNRVYVNYAHIFNNVRDKSSQKPLENTEAGVKAIALKLFKVDKLDGVIPTEYPFI